MESKLWILFGELLVNLKPAEKIYKGETHEDGSIIAIDYAGNGAATRLMFEGKEERDEAFKIIKCLLNPTKILEISNG